MIHQLKIDRHEYGDLGITVCPERHNPVVLIAWIEENISTTPEQRYPSGRLVCTPDRVDNDKN